MGRWTKSPSDPSCSRSIFSVLSWILVLNKLGKQLCSWCQTTYHHWAWVSPIRWPDMLRELCKIYWKQSSQPPSPHPNQLQASASAFSLHGTLEEIPNFLGTKGKGTYVSLEHLHVSLGGSRSIFCCHSIVSWNRDGKKYIASSNTRNSW